MNQPTKEAFLDDLILSLGKGWSLLAEGALNRKSPFHSLSVATISGKLPSQRIMILREVNPDKRILRFNTDMRTSKVSDISLSQPISVLAYHPEMKIQMRLSGLARIETTSEAADTAWDQASLYGKRCYLAQPAPGSPVSRPTSGLDPLMEGRKPEAEEVLPARKNFGILIAEINQIDWLYLAHTGHRRAEFRWNSQSRDWDSGWLVP
ncbi:flavin-binding protein [Parasphingorhabdus sp.]|uniref:flavin-binding protein n=1 Tax=Parasphingorhabdus sp. TaxID=2709688 RepID=UPI003263A628